MYDAELYKEFGLMLRDRRKKANLSQDALAEVASLSRTSVVNIERGRQGVSLSTLYRLANALACDSAELLPRVSSNTAVPPITVGGDSADAKQAVSRVIQRMDAENQS